MTPQYPVHCVQLNSIHTITAVQYIEIRFFQILPRYPNLLHIRPTVAADHMQFSQFTYALLSRHPEFLPANHITNIIDMSNRLNSFAADFNSFSRIMTDKTIVFALSRDSKRGYTFDIRFAPTHCNGKIGKHSIQHLSFDSTCYMRLTFSGILSVHRTPSTIYG